MTNTPSKEAKSAATTSKTSKSIQISPAPAIPAAVSAACKKLQKAGYKAWLAGGCVRDLIMARKPRDWDIVTDAPLEKIREAFPDHLEVGTAFGIVKLPPSGPKADPVEIDIAIFRREEGYSDRRHPDVVAPGNEQTDVARRDFTVNALYLDPNTNEIIDHVGGHKDIGAKTLRTVGTPNARFSEDALRILRAVRFAAQLGFKIDRETAVALKTCANLLKAISRERVRDEVFRLLASARPILGLEVLAQNGLWEHVFGVRRISLPADLRHLKLNWTPQPIHWLCALGVTGLLGDPLKESAEIEKRLTELLKLSNDEQRVLGRVLRVYIDALGDATGSPLDWVELTRSDRALMDLVKSFIRRARGPSEAEKEKALAFVEQSVRWSAKKDLEKQWPSAALLMKEGFKPGPKLGTELRARQWKAFWTKPA